MSTTALLFGLWRVDPFAIVFALAACAMGLRTRGAPMRAFYWACAVGLVVIAVMSPVGVLADGYLFSAHMLQHLLLVLVVPPLALLGFARDTPQPAPHASKGMRLPLVMWAAGVGAMWLWHAPTLCNAASESAVVHRVQEVSLLAMGLAFWWPILAPRGAGRLPPFAGMIYLFTACTACTVLGILVTFSPVEVCSVYLDPTDRLGVLPLLRQGWGLTPAKDQQLGGLLMWVPACFVYAVGILGLFARGYREAERAPPADARTAASRVEQP